MYNVSSLSNKLINQFKKGVCMCVWLYFLFVITLETLGSNTIKTWILQIEAEQKQQQE